MESGHTNKYKVFADREQRTKYYNQSELASIRGLIKLWFIYRQIEYKLVRNEEYFQDLAAEIIKDKEQTGEPAQITKSAIHDIYFLISDKNKKRIIHVDEISTYLTNYFIKIFGEKEFSVRLQDVIRDKDSKPETVETVISDFMTSCLKEKIDGKISLFDFTVKEHRHGIKIYTEIIIDDFANSYYHPHMLGNLSITLADKDDKLDVIESKIKADKIEYQGKFERQFSYWMPTLVSHYLTYYLREQTKMNIQKLNYDYYKGLLIINYSEVFFIPSNYFLRVQKNNEQNGMK
jgi:hypothetical protein